MSWSDGSGNNNDVILLDGVKFNSKYGGYVSFDASLSNSRGYISNDLHYAGGTKVIEELTVLVWMRDEITAMEKILQTDRMTSTSRRLSIFDRSGSIQFLSRRCRGQLKFFGQQ